VRLELGSPSLLYASVRAEQMDSAPCSTIFRRRRIFIISPSRVRKSRQVPYFADVFEILPKIGQALAVCLAPAGARTPLPGLRMWRLLFSATFSREWICGR
jgi:hypothetical protein